MNRPIKVIFFIYLLITALITIIPIGGPDIPSLHKIYVIGMRLDLLLHFLIFLPLVPLWFLYNPKQQPWTLIVFGLLIAVFTEGVHYVLPFRSFDLYDMLGNMAGIVPGAVGVLVVKR